MSTTIDNNVVEMRFNNSQFESGVKDTLKSLLDLKKGLELDSSASAASLKNIENAVTGISSKFTALGAVAFTVISNITTMAMNLGSRLVNEFAIQPITDGFAEYEQKMGSISTILGNTAKHGTGLETVNAELEKLNKYSDQTIYNFGDMTRNAALFTNAGLKIEDSTQMIKGFSNQAAAAGVDSSRAAGAAYQLSQALSTGTVRLMDWNSISTAGVGNDNMRRGLVAVAQAMGTLGAGTEVATKTNDNFRDSLKNGWLSTDVMSTYLKIMTNDYSEAEIAAMGFTDAQAADFKRQAESAYAAATEVRTLTQLMGTLKEGVGSTWGKTFELFFGDFKEATALFTGAKALLEPIINELGDARNSLVEGWAEAGGRADLFSGIGTMFSGLVSILQTVSKAAADVFPAITVQRLTDITRGFKEFADRMKPSEATLEKIGRVAKGVFSVFDVGRQIVVFLADSFAALLGGLLPAGVGLLDIAANLGDFLTSTNNAIKSGEGLGAIFKMIGDTVRGGLSHVGPMLSSIGTYMGMASAKAGELLEAFKSFGAGVPGLDSIGNSFKGLGEYVASFLSSAVTKLGEFLPSLSTLGDSLGSAIGGMFAKIDFGKVAGMISAGALTAVGLQIWKFVKSLTGISDSFGDITKGFSDILGGVTGKLEAAQNSLKAETLLKIAAAIGILALSLLVLSTIDGARLASASVGLGVAIGYMAAAMLVIDKMQVNPVKLGALAIGLILLGGAMLVMAAAIKVMSTMSWSELAVGLVGFGVALGAILIFSNLVSANAGNMIKASISIHLIAGAMLALAGAIAIFGTMPIDVLVQGGAAVGAVLLMLAGFVKLVPEKELLGTAFALAILSGALLVIAGAVMMLGSMSLESLALGLGALAITLGLLAVAAKLLQGSIAGAIAAAVIAGALMLLVPPILALGSAPWQVVALGLGAIAVALLILVGAAYAMQGAVGGAAAILIMSVALMALALAVVMLGSMSLESVGIALLALAGTLIIFGLAALLLTPVVPAMLAVSAALLLFGLAVLAGGVGVMALAFGLAMLAPVALAGAVGLLALGGAAAVIGLLAPLLAAAGAGMIVFGAGLLIASVGVIAFGSGLLILGMGLSMIAASGDAGVAALTALTGAMAGMLVHIPAMALMTGAFLPLGAAMVVMGAGAILLGAGVLVLSLGLVAFILVAPLVASGVEALVTAFGRLDEVTGSAATFVGALAPITGGLVIFVSAMLGASVSMLAFSAALVAVGIGGALAGSALTTLGVAASTAASIFTAAIASMGTAAESGVLAVTVALSALGPAVTTAAGQTTVASLAMVAAFVAMGAQSSAAVIAGSALIILALAPLPVAVTDTANLVAIASLLMVAAFVVMGVQSATAITASGVQISVALGVIAVSTGVAAEAVGRSIISGMVRGMANSTAVTTAARNVALNALNAAKAALDAHSPSREFVSLGKFSVIGLANGFDSESKTAETAASGMANSVLSAFSKTFGDISDSVNTSMDLNPTIRPVLDLGEVRKGARIVNGLMVPPSLEVSGGYARSAAGGFSDAQETSTSSGTTSAVTPSSVVYNQYNNSPRALSRSEIYRQTNNLLAQLSRKGV